MLGDRSVAPRQVIYQEAPNSIIPGNLLGSFKSEEFPESMEFSIIPGRAWNSGIFDWENLRVLEVWNFGILQVGILEVWKFENSSLEFLRYLLFFVCSFVWLFF